ncbi:MAG TPA: hypothetical protein VGK80_13105 [Rhodanobacteraceae bacterium]
MTAWTQPLARLRDLVFFRAGPQDMPYAPRTLVALLVIGAALEIAFDLYQGNSAAVIAGANVGTLAALAALFALLRWRGRSARFVQTALSLVATGLLFELVLLPLALMIGLPLTPNVQLNPRQTAALLALFVLALWQVAISVNILRHALDIPVAGGVLALLAIGFADLMASVLVAAAPGAWT